MIRESEYFEYAGRRSTEFGILNVAISEGLYQESFMPNRTINETIVRGREKPYFFEVTKEPKTFQLAFYFYEGWNDNLINEIAKWLNVDFYKPLSFSADWDKVYYCMPSESTDLIHNGLKQGYLTLTMRCDSPYSYSRDQVTPWFNVSSSPFTFEIMNRGHRDIKPFIYINKIGDGDISINNMSRSNSVMKVVSLKNGEQLKINGENEIIETSLSNISRYDNFNDFYLPLYVGNNVIQVTGTCKIKLQYRLKFEF